MEYKAAMTELEQILEEINTNQTDIDHLAKKIERASELIKICKTKLKTAEDQIQGVFAEES
jgi:exodeoxyribonuclease VII small subunit